MKKLIALVSALTVCTSCFSCTGKNKDKNKNSSGVSGEKIPDAKGLSAEKLANVAYKKQTLDIPIEIKAIYSSKVFNGGNSYLILGSGEKTPQFWVTDRDFSEFCKVDFKDFDIGINYNITVLDDGTVVSFVNSVDYGDLPAPDPTSPDYDQDVYDAAAEYSFRLYTYSPDGELLTENEITGLPLSAKDGIVLGSIAADGKTVVADINGTYEVFSADGTYIGELTAENEQSIENIGTDRDGNIICTVRTDDESVQFRHVTADGALEETDLTYKFPESAYYNIVPGSGDYSMYVSSMTTIYGIRAEDNSIEALFSLNAAGLNSSSFSDFSVGSDGCFIIPRHMSDPTVKKYTPCDPSELENLPVITIGIGTYNEDPTLSDVIEEFNENNDSFRVELKYYMENVTAPNHIDSDDEEAFAALEEKLDAAYNTACEAIRQDALDGDLPDILILGGGDGIDGQFGNIDLAEMDALCDLYDFMDKDDTLKRESFIPNVLNIVDEAFDGHAYALPTGFSVTLPNAAKSRYVGDVEKLDFDAYMDLIENEADILGRDDADIRPTRNERRGIANLLQWIDVEKAECHFDSPQFLRYLEYCYAGEPNPEDDEVYAYEKPTEEEAEQYYIRQQNLYIEDHALLNDIYIANYNAYLYDVIGAFGGEDITVLGDVDGEKGMASLGFHGSRFAIPKCSENKELAWEFIKYWLSDRFYNKNALNGYMFRFGFPVTVSALDLCRNAAKEPQDNTSYAGYENYTGYLYCTAYRDENGDYKYNKLGNVTDEVIAKVDDYINSAVITPEANRPSGEKGEKFSDVYDIFDEEMDRLFHNEITPEECAYMLQNRVSIYLSEQFG